jgi:WD40 repeat protein
MPRWLICPPEVAKTWEHDLLTLDGHLDIIVTMAFSLDGKYLASCSRDGILRVCEAITGECVATFSVRLTNLKPQAVTLSPNNALIAIAYVYNNKYYSSRSFDVIIYNFEDGTVLRELRGILTGRPQRRDTYGLRDGDLHICLAFRSASSDALTVVTLDHSKLEVWRTGAHSNDFERVWATEIRVRSYDPHQCLAMSIDASLVLVSPLGEGIIASWDLESGTPGKTHKSTERAGGFLALHGTDIIFETLSEGTTTLNRLNTQNESVEVFTRTWPGMFAIAHDNNKIAHAQTSSSVAHISMSPRALTLQSDIHWLKDQRRVELTSDGEKILVDCWDHLELRGLLGEMWFKSPTMQLRQPGHSLRYAMSKDGSVIALQLEGVMHVWHVESGRTQILPRLETDLYANPAISNDGKSLVLSCKERLIVWDLERNHESQSIDKLGRKIYGASFSDDGKTLLTIGENLDLDTGLWVANEYAPCDVPGPIDLVLGREWVSYDRQELLWLPTYYRPLHHTCSKARNTIVLVCRDGRVVIMKIVDPDGPSTSA